MDKSKRLKRVNDLRKDEERVAGHRLAEAQQEKTGKEQLLEQLREYQREYQQMFAEQSARGLSVQQYRNFQEFFLQLERAVAEQEKALELGEARVEQSRDQWLDKRVKTETLSRLRQGLDREAALLAEKSEQRQNDDRHLNSKHHGTN